MWTVTMTYGVDPATEILDSWEDALVDVDGVISRVPGLGTAITVHFDSGDAMKATQGAHDFLAKVVHAEPIEISVLSEALYDERAEAPTLPELMSAPDVGELLGISRQRVHQLRNTSAFPAALMELRTGPIWDGAAIHKFADEWERKPGRPKMHTVAD